MNKKLSVLAAYAADLTQEMDWAKQQMFGPIVKGTDPQKVDSPLFVALRIYWCKAQVLRHDVLAQYRRLERISRP